MVNSTFVFVATLLASAHGFQHQSARNSATGSRSALLMNKGGLHNELFQKMKKAVLPIVLGASIMLGDASNADAARSGGRSGGSSFRGGGGGGGGYRSSPARSSTQLSGSRGFSTPMIIPMYTPMYTPFYSPMYSPFGGFNLQLLLLGAGAYIIYSALSNRAGGSDFSNSEEGGALGTGATVMKVQIALESDWAERSNIMNTLSMLAEKNSALSGREDIAKLLSEASLALLRKQGDWNSAAYEGELFRQGGQAAEPAFQKLAIKERAKFEEEVSSVATVRPSQMGSTPTQVVVSIVVAMRGKSSAYMPNNLRTVSDVSACLQGLAADALTDNGNNVMAVEVLWTPSESGNTISSRELIEDYPELLRL